MFSNWLVGSITVLSLIMLFWPLLAKVMARLRPPTPKAA
jgi:putative tricarboxylic transport membrane protein